jgi:hypothetical protein
MIETRESLALSTSENRVFIAHFNFCRVNSAQKQTPVMSAELTDHVWTVEELFFQP